MKRIICTFNVTVVIRSKEYEERQLDYEATFCYNSELVGKKTYLSIEPINGRGLADHYYDLRYEESYNSSELMTFLTLWAENHWTGENGSWKLIGITISYEGTEED